MKYQNQPIDWVNTIFLITAPFIGVIGTYYHIQLEGFSYPVLIMSLILYVFTGLSITAGYHRLFSHRGYEAHWSVKLFFLIFGGAAAQNSVLRWGRDHRVHHQFTDTKKDPYSVTEGFFHAHMGWIFKKDNQGDDFPKDLANDKLIALQHKYYMPMLIWVSFLIPTLIGLYFGAPIGGLMMAGFLRISLVHHFTFFINSLCHVVGKRPYDFHSTAGDNWISALFTFGEGYHNYHHKFQTDYRNAIKYHQFDPAKWFIFSLSKIGLAKNLKRVPKEEILKARLAADMQRLEHKAKQKSPFNETLEEAKLKIELKIKELKCLKEAYLRKNLLKEIEMDLRNFERICNRYLSMA